MRRIRALFLALVVAFGMTASPSLADWLLPSIISSNMVLQQKTAAPLWGWDEPGTQITVDMIPVDPTRGVPVLLALTAAQAELRVFNH